MSSSAAERHASASTKYTTSRSERLVEELKARRFRQIFTYLDQVLPCPLPSFEHCSDCSKSLYLQRHVAQIVAQKPGSCRGQMSRLKMSRRVLQLKV